MPYGPHFFGAPACPTDQGRHAEVNHRTSQVSPLRGNPIKKKQTLYR